jgi:hypothetical protein
VGSFWAEVGKDRERKLRQQRRNDAWLRKQAGIDERRSQRQEVAQAKATKAEQARQAREDGLAEVEARDAALVEELAGFLDVLPAVVALEPRTLGWLRAHPPTVEFEPPDLEPAGRRPVWSDFAPPEPGLFGRWRYERAVSEAQAQLAQAGQEYDQRCAALRSSSRSTYPTSTSSRPSERGATSPRSSGSTRCHVRTRTRRGSTPT